MGRNNSIRIWAATGLAVAAMAGTASAQTFDFGFESGYEDWIADFADYPVDDSTTYGLAHKHMAFKVSPAQNGLALRGNNMSDDLFLFVKRKITGLAPNAPYRISFTVDALAKMPPDGFGGGSYYLKVGAVPGEPKKVAQSGMYRMNIDKANQAASGREMVSLGHLRHGEAGSFAPHLVSYSNKDPFVVTSNGQGEAWLIVGVESTFEVADTFFVAGIKAVLSTTTSIAPARKPGRYVTYPLPGCGIWMRGPDGREFTAMGRGRSKQ